SCSPHLFFQSPGSGVLAVGFEGIRADQFGEVAGLIRWRRTHWPHFQYLDRKAAARNLPRRLGSGQTRTDNPNLQIHAAFSASRRTPSLGSKTNHQWSRKVAPSDLYSSMADLFQSSTSHRMARQFSFLAMFAT